MAFLDVFKKQKNPKSPSKAGGDTEGSISADVIPFLNIIAKNSLALPGMARDMNVLRQNIVKLVKLKNAEAITKADKFFKSEDQRESELEEARKKETSPQAMTKEDKPKKEKDSSGGEEGVLGYLWGLLKNVLGKLFFGLALALGAAFDLSKIVGDIADKLNPLPLIEGLFQSIKDGWKAVTETDIVKETLIKGVGKFLDFITAGLFGEEDLRKSLDDLTTYITPMIDVITETFEKIVGWMKDNIGWEPFTIPLSKVNEYLPDWAKKFSLPDIQVPGFRPFQKNKEMPAPTTSSKSAPPTAPTEDLKKAKTTQGDVVYDEMGNVVSGTPTTEPTPTKQTASKTPESKVKRSTEDLAKEAGQDKKKAVEFLKTQVGVVFDPKSPTQFADIKTGKPLDEQSVRDRIVDMRGDPDKILSLMKGATAVKATSTPSSLTAPSEGAPTGGAPSAASVGGSSPSAEAAPSSSTSGASISQASSEVAEGQRMDAAADAGTVIDAGVTNNSMGSTGNKSKQISDVFNSSFIDNYYSNRTATA
jgi:hypothetical protein